MLVRSVIKHADMFIDGHNAIMPQKQCYKEGNKKKYYQSHAAKCVPTKRNQIDDAKAVDIDSA